MENYIASLLSGFFGGVLGTLVLQWIQHRLALSRDVAKEERDVAREAMEESNRIKSALAEVVLRTDSFDIADVDRLVAPKLRHEVRTKIDTLRVDAKEFLVTRHDVEKFRADTPTPEETAIAGAKWRVSHPAVALSVEPPIVAEHRGKQGILAYFEGDLSSKADRLRAQIEETLRLLETHYPSQRKPR
jgi:hypothetical protein